MMNISQSPIMQSLGLILLLFEFLKYLCFNFMLIKGTGVLKSKTFLLGMLRAAVAAEGKSSGVAGK